MSYLGYCRVLRFLNHEPNETSMYGSCEEFSSKMLRTPLNLLQGVFHIRKLPVANLTKVNSVVRQWCSWAPGNI